MKKVGILGGTFDPIHFGHISIARAALSEFNLSEVRVMTGGMPPHKRGKLTEASLRHTMVELALLGEDKIVPFDYEVSKTQYTYTAKTLLELKELHPDWEIYFIIGEDSLYDLPDWYEPQTVADNCILLVYPRDNTNSLYELIDERKKQFNADIRPIKAPLMDISSSYIRECVREGKRIDDFVPEAVAKFIKEKGLYV